MSDTEEERAEADPREDVRLSAAGRTTPRRPPQTLTDLSVQWFPVAEGRPPTQVSCVRLPNRNRSSAWILFATGGGGSLSCYCWPQLLQCGSQDDRLISKVLPDFLFVSYFFILCIWTSWS